MLACVCHAFGTPDTLVVEEVPVPQPGAGEVLVKIAAAGANFADILMVAGRYQVRPTFPFIAGLEFSGVVTALGEGVTAWRVGDRVMGAPSEGGCFAEYIAVPAARLFAVPPENELPLETAAALLIGYGTAAYSILSRAQLKPGETILVTGAGGGVGLAAVEIAHRLGAKVIAAAGSAAKLDAAMRLGASWSVDYSVSDLRQAVNGITEGRGVDVVIDMVGGQVFDASLRATARWGRVVVVGFAGGDIPRIPAEYLLVKNLAVLGSGFGATLAVGDMTLARGTIDQVLAMNRATPLDVVLGGRFSLAEAPAALAALSDRKATGKLLVIPMSGAGA